MRLHLRGKEFSFAFLWMCVALREGKEAIFRFLCIAEQVCRFGLDFSEGKGTFNYTYSVIKALFLGMNCWQQFSNVCGFLGFFFFWRWFHVAQAGFRFAVYLRMTLNS